MYSSFKTFTILLSVLLVGGHSCHSSNADFLFLELPNEDSLKLISYLSPFDILKISATSHTHQTFCNDEAIWKNTANSLPISEIEKGKLKFKLSWKQLVIGCLAWQKIDQIDNELWSMPVKINYTSTNYRYDEGKFGIRLHGFDSFFDGYQSTENAQQQKELQKQRKELQEQKKPLRELAARNGCEEAISFECLNRYKTCFVFFYKNDEENKTQEKFIEYSDLLLQYIEKGSEVALEKLFELYDNNKVNSSIIGYIKESGSFLKFQQSLKNEVFKDINTQIMQKCPLLMEKK